MRMFFRTQLLIWFLCLFSLQNVEAFESKSGELLLSADKADILQSEQDGRVIVLKGHVQVIYRKQHLSATEIRIYNKSKMVDALGEVVMLAPEVRLQADRVVLNTETDTGTIYNGLILMGQVQVQGAVIEKTGPVTYIADSGQYTACLTCPPEWSFSGSHISAEVGGYTHIRNPLLKLGGVPIFWLPYLIIPLKSERQTGLLFPQFETSESSGFAVSEGFFIALSKSQDATLRVKNYERRGWKNELEYRYVIDDNSKGQLQFAHLRDLSLQSINQNSPLERYWLKYDHYYLLPGKFIQRANLNTVSDIRYPRDFNAEIEGHGAPALENIVSLTKNTETVHSSIEVGYYINLLQPGYRSENKDAVHRVPDIKLQTVPIPVGLGDMTYSVQSQFVSFQRNSSSYDDVNGDGIFNPDVDRYRTGQRLEINPKVQYPFQIGQYIDIQPSLAFHDIHYYFQNTSPLGQTNQSGLATSNQPSAERRFIREQISARTRLSSVFGDLSESAPFRYKHEIVPELSYSAMPWLQNTSHPFFGGVQDIQPYYRSSIPASDNDLIQFDYADRLIERDLFTLSVTNRLIRRQWIDGKPDYKQLASLKFSQSYDYYETYRDNATNRRPFSSLSALLDVRIDNFEINSLSRFYHYENVGTTSTRGRIYSERGDFLQADYSQQYRFKPIDPVTQAQSTDLDISSRSEDIIGSIGLVTTHITALAGIQYSFVTHLMNGYNLGLDLRPPGKCWNMSFRYNKPLLAGSTISYAFEFLFDGKNATSVAPARTN